MINGKKYRNKNLSTKNKDVKTRKYNICDLYREKNLIKQSPHTI